VKVVVCDTAGNVTLPLASGWTPPGLVPALAVITTDVAFFEVQDSVTGTPASIAVGVAVRVTLTGGGELTVTVACEVAVPPGPVTVKI
jgi:hypothetical protein